MEPTANSTTLAGAAGVENRTLRERVYDTLREDILSGRLRPGAELSEVALSDRLGVSRAPIREALSRLRAAGLVTMRPRRGAHVSVLTRQEFVDAYQVREALESLAARLTAGHLHDGDLDELEALHQEMRAAVEDVAVDRFFELNRRFHAALVALSGNGRLVAVHGELLEQMGRYTAPSLSLRGNLDRSLVEHEQILDALRSRDGDAAAVAVRRHIQVPQASAELVADEILERVGTPKASDDFAGHELAG
jgi:DNA-binding GntR family transcriptional regulator